MNQSTHRRIDSDLIQESVELAPLTTYKLGGPARYLADVADRDELDSVLEFARTNTESVLVLGRGSNLVVSDRGFDGLVLRLSGAFKTANLAGNGLVTAGAAMSLPALARYAVKRGRGGLEFFVGIPGSVGGAVRMNAGCHGSETVDSLDRAEIVDASDGGSEWHVASELDLSYRYSNLADHQIVTRAAFGTVDASPDAGEELMREITRWRKSHQPGGTLNAGSVFKNPQGDAAGRIIDGLGLKGMTRGEVSVSDRHANFFVALSGATAQDVYDLVQAVRRKVEERTGITLVPELRFVGVFDEDET